MWWYQDEGEKRLLVLWADPHLTTDGAALGRVASYIDTELHKTGLREGAPAGIGVAAFPSSPGVERRAYPTDQAARRLTAAIDTLTTSVDWESAARDEVSQQMEISTEQCISFDSVFAGLQGRLPSGLQLWRPAVDALLNEVAGENGYVVDSGYMTSGIALRESPRIRSAGR